MPFKKYIHLPSSALGFRSGHLFLRRNHVSTWYGSISTYSSNRMSFPNPIGVRASKVSASAAGPFPSTFPIGIRTQRIHGPLRIRLVQIRGQEKFLDFAQWKFFRSVVMAQSAIPEIEKEDRDADQEISTRILMRRFRNEYWARIPCLLQLLRIWCGQKTKDFPGYLFLKWTDPA